MVGKRTSPVKTGKAKGLLVNHARAVLETYCEGGAPVLAQVSETLYELFVGSEAGAYGLSSTPALTLNFAYWHRGTITGDQVSQAASACESRKVIPYNPRCPDPAERNRVVRPYARFGLHLREYEGAHYAGLNNDQLRVLVCDGPSFLAWVGVFREVVFTEQDELVFGELVPALQRRLSNDRRLGNAELAEAALFAALETLDGAAFVVNRHAHVLYANRTGQSLLDEKRALWGARLQSALLTSTSRCPTAELTVSPLLLRGSPPCYLVTFRGEAREAAARLRAKADQWRLTTQQMRVVDLLVRGEPNKSIAAALACSVRTVEHHVGAALVKARVESRSELVARFWSE